MIPLLLALATTPPTLQDQMHAYFDGELAGGSAFLAAGLGGALAGSFLLASDSDVAHGAAYPTLAVGAIQLVVGIVLHARTGSQVADLDARYARDRAKMVASERARMEGVHTGFAIYKWVELGLAVAGAGLAVAGHVTDEQIVQGVGYGLAAEALLMLLLDFFAERRADRYGAALTGT